MIIFVHIPRTGGTSLSQALISLIDGEIVHTNELEALPEDAAMAHGHIVLDETWPELAKGFKSLTVLRDPVDRVVSLYYRFRRDAGYPFHEELQTMSLADFVASGQFAQTYQACNDMTRRLSGQVFGHDQTPWCALDRALLNLEAFTVVGIYPWFRPLRASLWLETGLRLPLLEPVGTDYKRPTLGEIAPVDLEAVQEYNQLDLALYSAAVERAAGDLHRQAQSG